jgi:hypothetical protein
MFGQKLFRELNAVTCFVAVETVRLQIPELRRALARRTAPWGSSPMSVDHRGRFRG